MTFAKGFDYAPSVPEESFYFVFNGHNILVFEMNGEISIPRKSDLESRGIHASNCQYFGRLDDQPCFAGETSDEPCADDVLVLTSVRSLFRRIDAELVMVVGLAGQLLSWDRNHRFCGSCGHPTVNKQDERARCCPQCGLVNYPRVSPAIIVAVLKGDRILLARSPRFSGGFYSVLAGFVEPGETLEECVRREVLEEVGITVRNISYFGSQPWPFPDSEMIGFTAEYASGELCPDESEIADADWFAADELPEIPPPISIARRLIDWFLAGSGPPAR